MDSKKYNRSVELVCPTCGNRQFLTSANIADLDDMMRCPSCNREMSKDELIQENTANQEANVDEIGNAVTKDLVKELNSILGKEFK